MPDCDIPSERLGLGAQGEATTVAIAVRITTATGGACLAAGTPVLLRIANLHGHLLHVTGNPAIADLGTSNNNGTNVFDWSNWCGPTATHAVLVADVASGGGKRVRYRLQILPTCLSNKFPSQLSVITE